MRLLKRIMLLSYFNVPCSNVSDNKQDFNEILSRVFAEAKKQKTGQSPNEIESTIVRNPLEGLSDEAIKRQAGLSPEEIKQAAKLISSGQFRADLSEIVILAISTIPGMEKVLHQNAARLANDINDLKTKNLLESFHRCLSSIQAKETCTKLQDFYSDPISKVFRGTLIGLLNNDSFRLALVVYAQSNGVEINYKDLDLVKEQLNQDSLNFDELVQAGQQRLEAKYKINEAKEKIEALKLSCKGL